MNQEQPTLRRIGRRKYMVTIGGADVGVVWAPNGNSGSGWSARSEDSRPLGRWFPNRAAAVNAVRVHELMVGLDD